jgi:FimV-like protein
MRLNRFFAFSAASPFWHDLFQVLLVFGLGCAIASQTAFAFMVGEPELLSAPGQVLRVDLPLRSIQAHELRNFDVQLASKKTFETAGLSFDPRLEGLTAKLESTAGGQAVIHLTGTQPMPEGFIGLLIEIRWNQRRMLQQIGLQIDPGAPGQNTISTPQRIEVVSGDTASKLLLSHSAGLDSLNQALMALLEANPDAFEAHNVNRLRAGAVLVMPDAETIATVQPEVAQEQIQMQAQEFAVYRQELLKHLIDSPDANTASSSSSGKVQTPPVDQLNKGDRLTLSTPEHSTEDQLAMQRQAQAAADRAAEINQNIQELNKLAQASAGAGIDVTGQQQQPAIKPAVAWATLAMLIALMGLGLWRLQHQKKTIHPGFSLNLPSIDSLQPLDEAHAKLSIPITAVQLQDAVMPPIQAEPKPIDFGGLSLDLETSNQAVKPRSIEDAVELRMELAELLWQSGLKYTAKELVSEVSLQASADWQLKAQLWLSQKA